MENKSIRRRKSYIIFILTLVFVTMLFSTIYDFHGQYTAEDKQLHYALGKIITAILFLSSYFFTVIRLSIKVSNASFLWWLPSIIMVCFIMAIVLIFGIAIFKEVLDSGGLGKTEWLDVEATMHGAYSLFPIIAIIVSLTPFLLPFEMTAQIPKMVKEDFKSGFQVLDHFVKTQKFHKKSNKNPTILLAEDDILYATMMLEFFESLNLQCIHVATAESTLQSIHKYHNSLKLIILDNFLRVEDFRNRQTGSDILKTIREKYKNINCKVMMISGHTHMIGEAASLADAIMQKPWNSHELMNYLSRWEIL